MRGPPSVIPDDETEAGGQRAGNQQGYIVRLSQRGGGGETGGRGRGREEGEEETESRERTQVTTR